MKNALQHLLNDETSSAYIFARQGNERTVGLLTSVNDRSDISEEGISVQKAAFVLLSLPPAFCSDPGQGTASNLLEHVPDDEYVQVYQAFKHLIRPGQPPAAAGDIRSPFHPYKLPIDFLQVIDPLIVL